MMANDRYSRQIVLKGFGFNGQQKLAGARVLVIGAGGLGCPALQYLAGAGVGQIGIVDGDTVSLSNLHRQPLYATQDVGNMKAVVANEKLTALNPDIEIDFFPVFLAKENFFEITTGYDILLDCTDNFETRYLLNDGCALLNKPLIFAAVSGFEGQVAVFAREEKTGLRTNYRDLFPVQPLQREIANCEENGVIGVLPGIIGAMQAAEAIKMITGLGTPLINKLVNYNLLTQEIYEIVIVPAPSGGYQLPPNNVEFLNTNYGGSKKQQNIAVVEIDIEQLTEILQNPSASVIDVRELFERPAINKIGNVKIPMSVFSKEIEKFTPEDNIVLICQHGIRSLAAGQILMEKYGNNKNVYSLKGGVARWGDFLHEDDE